VKKLLAALVRFRAFGAMRYHQYRLLTYTQIFSNMGTWMEEVTRGWLIYQLTDSVFQLGLVRGVQLIPLLLLSPLAGSAADRYSRRKLLLAAQSLGIVIFAAMALLVYTDLVRPWHVYLAAILIGAAQAFQQPSRASLVSDTVPLEYLTNAIGLNSLIFNMARVCGPALAGALIASSGTGGAYAVQAAFLLLATAWTVQLRPFKRPARATDQPPRESFGQSILEGWKFSWRSEPVRAGLLCTLIVSLLIAPFTTLLPVFARDLFSVGATGQGFMLTAMGLGALISSGLIASVGHKMIRGKVMLQSSMIYGFLLLIFAYSPWFPLSLAVMVVAGLLHVHANALVHTVVQSYSPPEFRGRTMAMFNMAQLLTTAGGMLIGVVAVWLGPRGAVAVMGVAGSIAIIALYMTLPQARHIK
jgi:MFS family permease